MIRKTLTTSIALAVLASTSIAVSQPAFAKKMKMVKKVKLVPAAPKPSFHATPYGGPMMIVDIPQVPAGGGALGLGLAPSTNLFKGVPVIGDLGL